MPSKTETDRWIDINKGCRGCLFVSHHESSDKNTLINYKLT